MDTLAGLIGEVRVRVTATILGLLPCAGRRCFCWHRRLHILWHRLIVIVDSDALLAELLDLLPRCSTRQAAFNFCRSIVSGRTIWVDRITGRGGRSLHGCLAWEGLRRCHVNSEVLLVDVEDSAIIEIIDANEIAHRLFPVHAPLALSCHKDTGETALDFVRPCLPNAHARDEESCHVRAYGSDSARGGG